MIDQTIDLGNQILKQLPSNNKPYQNLTERLRNFDGDWGNSEELFSWFVAIIALEATSRGNYGIGSAIVNEQGLLICYSGNQVFHPSFRSDGHAEMMVLNNFEADCINKFKLSSCILYTSLESCPMCLTRAISSQIGSVLHVADDHLGGMTRQRQSLPSVWQKLQSEKIYRQANCSDILRKIALDIFLSNVEQLNQNLSNRSQT
ncbi:MAG: nucleoside deaminase [Xenococcaceae cyanobacterium MO_188.B19]|nr:nucleoside deaminase [Xenococcaceae cyanobacterium MO_188.B19]